MRHITLFLSLLFFVSCANFKSRSPSSSNPNEFRYTECILINHDVNEKGSKREAVEDYFSRNTGRVSLIVSSVEVASINPVVAASEFITLKGYYSPGAVSSDALQVAEVKGIKMEFRGCHTKWFAD